MKHDEMKTTEQSDLRWEMCARSLISSRISQLKNNKTLYYAINLLKSGAKKESRDLQQISKTLYVSLIVVK
jgi:hypothetical protein